MIQINQIKLKLDQNELDLKKKIVKLLRIDEAQIQNVEVIRRSIDARNKDEIFYVYSVNVFLYEESKVKRIKNRNILYGQTTEHYQCHATGSQMLCEAPIIIGSGPCGLFLTYRLALMGYRPILLEQGKEISKRKLDVEAFWSGKSLDPYSNVQFGEGGAGTFSDGKINTSIKDPAMRGRYVLQTFVKHGAPKDILYDSKPHIGTDMLSDIIVSMREEILRLGGRVLFSHSVRDIKVEKGKLVGLFVDNLLTGESFVMPSKVAALCIGHSSRDLFASLYKKGLLMEQKSFAVGVRVEHLQSMINEAQYGKNLSASLPAASYKLTAKSGNGRGVYTFCMCPGGYVINASSQNRHLAVNGMSYHSRSGIHANSAVVVTVNQKDYGNHHVLAGVKFQCALEEKAWELGDGCIPVQTFGDFKENICKSRDIIPQMKGAYTWANLRTLFSSDIASSIIEGMESFDKKIPGFADDSVILSGVESRTSSPVRLLRNQEGVSNISGLYTGGEGAGYAGGIMSASIDGLKISESIAKEYQV